MFVINVQSKMVFRLLNVTLFLRGKGGGGVSVEDMGRGVNHLSINGLRSFAMTKTIIIATD